MTLPPVAWRLLIDPAADGAWNMAVDEAILERYGSDPVARAPTLRLYAWDPPALSLGRTQAAAGAYDPVYLREQGIDLVRRPTGGLAVLHQQERTYAVVGPLGSGAFSGGVLATYRRIADALTLALGRLGVDAAARTGPLPSEDERSVGPACFELTSAHEVTVVDRKLVGSAQLRRRGAFLQHGSIPLVNDATRLGRALGGEARGERFTDLRRAAGREIRAGELDEALIHAFAEAFGVELRRGKLTAAEQLRAARLRCWKYDSAAWTLDGRLGRRERRWGPAI